MSKRLFNLDGFTAAFVALWVLGVLLSVGIVGVVVWAVIKLVSHFTA